MHRRAAIARDKTGSIQSRRLVAQVLQHGDADQSLAACQIEPASLALVLVIKGKCRESHDVTSN